MSEVRGPVLSNCRTGTRYSSLWAASGRNGPASSAPSLSIRADGRSVRPEPLSLFSQRRGFTLRHSRRPFAASGEKTTLCVTA